MKYRNEMFSSKRNDIYNRNRRKQIWNILSLIYTERQDTTNKGCGREVGSSDGLTIFLLELILLLQVFFKINSFYHGVGLPVVYI
jgi:hypothetical protein